MELHQVRYFLAVASTLNFTRAAEQCNVTQPALTKGVQKLEQELGGQLIYRERQLTQLTDLGKEVLPMLERTLASAEAVRRRAQEFQRKEVAPLKIGLAPSISVSLVLDPSRRSQSSSLDFTSSCARARRRNSSTSCLRGRSTPQWSGTCRTYPPASTTGRCSRSATSRFSRRHTCSQTVPRSASTTSARPSCWNAPNVMSPEIQRSYFPEEPLRLGHSSGHDLHLQHMAAAGLA